MNSVIVVAVVIVATALAKAIRQIRPSVHFTTAVPSGHVISYVLLSLSAYVFAFFTPVSQNRQSFARL
jgi:hypothetical protein